MSRGGYEDGATSRRVRSGWRGAGHHLGWRDSLAQKAGGILKSYSIDSPASMSIHEEATVYALRPMMGVFNNLVMYDHHIKQNSMTSLPGQPLTQCRNGVPLPCRSGPDCLPFDTQGPKVRRLFAGGNRIRTIGPALVKGLSAVADEGCRTDKLDGVIKHRSSRETTMVGREASLDGRLFLGGTDGSNPIPSGRVCELSVPECQTRNRRHDA
jgi:hypothetical protein